MATREVEVLVEVGVATCRPPRTDAFVYVHLLVERTSRTNVLVDAETTAILMAESHPHVVMATSACIVDWDDPADPLPQPRQGPRPTKATPGRSGSR